ncbi:MAG: bifunctional precorrin-2 dehydrogenase/sirohydrochlorin ferrochelatase [Desulfobacteraceae bacterium]|nr:bifunctional precorrin-2 dehydrogenase/sirohydrochlorin ferrochelatase [Desulfobacteraceae bacterium]
MKYYPVCLDINNRKCLVVGGGQVGTRKVRTLLFCGATVTVVSPETTDELSGLARQGKITLLERPYHRTDIENVFLVIGATNDQCLNQRIHKDAEQAQRLCNIADKPDLCNFILPSVINQGDLMLTISTSGRSPAFAKHLRRKLQSEFGPEYGVFLELMGSIRDRLLAKEHAPEAHKPLFEKLIQSGLLVLIKADDQNKIDELLYHVLGDGFEYRNLMENH